VQGARCLKASASAPRLSQDLGAGAPRQSRDRCAARARARPGRASSSAGVMLMASRSRRGVGAARASAKSRSMTSPGSVSRSSLNSATTCSRPLRRERRAAQRRALAEQAGPCAAPWGRVARYSACRPPSPKAATPGGCRSAARPPRCCARRPREARAWRAGSQGGAARGPAPAGCAWARARPARACRTGGARARARPAARPTARPLPRSTLRARPVEHHARCTRPACSAHAPLNTLVPHQSALRLARAPAAGHMRLVRRGPAAQSADRVLTTQWGSRSCS